VKSEPAEFFQAAQNLFLSQCSTRNNRRQNYLIGDTTLVIESVGETLAARLTRALSHLTQSEQSTPDLIVQAWDSPQDRMISPPWDKYDYGSRGEIRGFNLGRFRTAFDHGTGALSMIDLERGHALFWVRNAEKLPSYESAAPLRTILAWWMEYNGRVLIHGGAIARDEHRSILLAGPGGSGKSTVALLCLEAGWKYLADDYCILDPSGQVPRLFSLYNSAKISQTWLRDAPQLRNLGEASSDMHADKQLLFLHERRPDRLLYSAKTKVVLLPGISKNQNTTIEDATAAEALRALAPSSIFQAVTKGEIMFRRISEAVQRLPVRRLNMGSDLSEIPRQIARCLEEI
jgi:hypothetical protein